jgi:biotin carboxyl carrier protein
MMVSGSAVEMELQYHLSDATHIVRLERDGEIVRIAIADRIYEVNVIHSRSGEVTFKVDGVMHTAFIAYDRSPCYVAVDGDTFEVKKPDPRRVRRRQHHSEDNLIASMPGQVTKVLVGEGDNVQRGQPLLVLAAMKMEIKIAAPHDGRVAKVLVKPGQVVDRGHALIEMTKEQ